MIPAFRTCSHAPSPALVLSHFGLAGVCLVLACGAALIGAAEFARSLR